jgi:molecular chaperone HtpG
MELSPNRKGVESMAEWVKRIPFQVDVPGIISLMGSSLYSRPDAAVRELIQNAHDGIMRRRDCDLSYQGRLDVRQDPQRRLLQFVDDGIGLTAAEAEKYVGTLGISLTGLIKSSGRQAARHVTNNQLIGQFGIGLFSAFMLADRIILESRRLGADDAVRWEAGANTEIELRSHRMDAPGTVVTLVLKQEFSHLATEFEPLEAAIHEYADFLAVPVFINGGKSRANLIHAAWFEPTPDSEAVAMALETYFDEAPLDVITIQRERPVTIRGAIYVTPQRTPGFSGSPTVAVTLRGMVISRRIQELLPEWALFLRGVLELSECSPTASREDLVKDEQWRLVRQTLEDILFEHFESLARTDMPRLSATVEWHRYAFAGAALSHSRLRRLLRSVYRFTTSAGQMTFDAILDRSKADPLYETDADRVLWYNPDRRQEQWINGLFRDGPPCVHTLRSFEESLLASMAGDVDQERVILRVASPSTKTFAAEILGARDIEEVDASWRDFLASENTSVMVGSFHSEEPVIAFLSDRKQLLQTFDELKKKGTIPPGFQRLIDTHFEGEVAGRNEILLNRQHALVARALSGSTAHPLAAVLRVLVAGSLTAAGVSVDAAMHRRYRDDIEWIATALWYRNSERATGTRDDDSSGAERMNCDE